MTQAFERPDMWRNRATPITSDVSTMEEIASTVSRVLEKNVEYQQISWDEIKAQQSDELAEMYHCFDLYGMDGSPYYLRRWLGQATSFEGYLRRAGWSDR
ncbi:MAG: hypothetical protein AAF851_22535 [Myxococcota bacterium]